MKIEKAQVTQTMVTVTLENFQESEMLRIIAIVAKNKLKEEDVFGKQEYCNLPFNLWYSFIDKIVREVANA